MLSSSNAAASLVERAYYTGYTLTTLGYGDFVAGNDSWRIPSVLAAANGFFLFTLSITYILNIITNVVQKRQISLAIAKLYQAISIIYFVSAKLDFASREQLLITRKIIEQFLDTLGSAFIYPSQHIPDIHRLTGVEKSNTEIIAYI